MVARRRANADEERRIRDYVSEAASVFRDARVTTFVPVLVERRVRARLATAG
ncbi:hypothetical protein Acsp06_62710 [Actinomycetospora sp. NBRC 106375]|nr:hypothetical protein Acsp06_62710 [Actinomycetospora sp. NBRC 106375]